MLRRLGKSCLYASKVILGTALYSSPKFQEFLLEEKESLSLLRYAWQKGIRTWDIVFCSESSWRGLRN